jgi:hypothetical protein
VLDIGLASNKGIAMTSTRHLTKIGLAVAFGIGAAVFTGHGVASASPTESSSPLHTSPPSSSQPSASDPSAATRVRQPNASAILRSALAVVKSVLPQTAWAPVTKTPAAPAGPTGPPILLAAMAWARREVQDTLSTVRESLTVSQPTTVAEASSPALLPQHVALRPPLTRVFFPEVNQLLETGPNTLATGHPIASRAVIYNNSADDNFRVTYAVDVYPDVASAKAAYQEALTLSVGAPGFQQLPDPKIGTESFAGTSSGIDPVTGAELKHVGVGVRVGNIIIGVTRAGYDADRKPSEKLSSSPADKLGTPRCWCRCTTSSVGGEFVPP